MKPGSQSGTYISLWLCLPVKFFKWKLNKSQEKDIYRKIEEENILGIREYFANTSYQTNIIPIPKFWNSKTILIPFCTEVGYLYSYSQENYTG